MSIAHLLTQPLSIQARATAADGYGDPVLGPSGSPVVVLGFLEQQTTVEHLLDRDTTVTKWVAYLPAATAIGRFDYLTFQSSRFEVTGEPEHCYNPRTKIVSHIRCDLTVAV